MTGAPEADLVGTVALVAGASRGVGRGVAVALGAAGATVHVTARSTVGGARTEHLPGTVEETAAAVTAAGGRGVAHRCDHTEEPQVEALVEQIVAREDRIDILVNCVWSGYERSAEVRFDAPFWRQPMWRYDLFASSLRAQYLTSRVVGAVMVDNRHGLIVGLSYTDGDTPLGQAAYDVAKTAANRLSVVLADEGRRHGVHAVGLLPGFVHTERVAGAWDAIGEGPRAVLHSPDYVGRAVVALYASADLAELSGRVLPVGDLAERFGFTDVDGRRPPSFTLEGPLSLATRMDRLNRLARAVAPVPSPPKGASS